MTLSFKKKLVVVLTVILALWMLFMGVTKLSVSDQIIDAFLRWDLPRWLIFPVGISEAVAAVALFFPKYRNYAMAFIVLLMAGAIAVHIRVDEHLQVFVPFAVIVLAVATLLLRFQVSRAEADREDDGH